MTDDEKARKSYGEGAVLTYELIGIFKVFEFVFPPSEVAIIGSIVDIGDKLARNDAARELIARLIKEFDRRKMKDYLTVMMLKVCLEQHGIPIKTVPFEELGLKGTWQRMSGDGGSN